MKSQIDQEEEEDVDDENKIEIPNQIEKRNLCARVLVRRFSGCALFQYYYGVSL